jgi:hypothetical protein
LISAFGHLSFRNKANGAGIRSQIFDKLGISSRVELVLYALSHGGPRQAEWVAGFGA